MKIEERKSKQYSLSIVFLVVIIGFTTYLILKNNDVSDLYKTIMNSQLRYIVIALLMVLIHIIGEGISMKKIASCYDTKIGLVRSVRYACIDLYYCAITPSASGGQPILAYYMSKDNIPVSRSSIILLLYTVIYKMILLLLGVFVAIVHNDFIFQHGTLIRVCFGIGVIINISIIAICLFSMFSKNLARIISEKIVWVGVKIHVIKDEQVTRVKLNRHLEDYQNSANLFMEHKRDMAWVSLIVLIQRIAYFSVGYLVYRSFEFSQFSYFDILSLQIIVSITVDSLPVPGAVGVTEAVFMILYEVVYSKAVLTSAMILTRGITFYFCLLVCGLTTAFHHITIMRREKRREGRMKKSDRFL